MDFETSKPNEDFKTEYEHEAFLEEEAGKFSPADLTEDKDGDQLISHETHIPNLIDTDEQFDEHYNIPREDSPPVQSRASPKLVEDSDFDFEKKLPEIPQGNGRDESESQMKFSTTHFQDEDEEPLEDKDYLSQELDMKKEEYSHDDVEEVKEEAEEALEESHFKKEEEPHEALPSKQEEILTPSFNPLPTPGPVLLEEPKQNENFYSPQQPVEKLVNTSSNSHPESKSTNSPKEKITLVEPPKNRSVKSIRSEGASRNFLVVDLVYWRDPKKSGIVLGAILVILLSLSVVSVVSVVSYSALAVLTGTLTFRLYKNVLQAVQKTQDGHPFKEYLEKDVTVTTEKVHEVADLTAAKLNATLLELRRLFLVEDLVDSVKFALILWGLTYVGSWFNGLTLVILGVVGLFSLPKVYETHQEKIDQNLDVVRGKINEIVDKVQAVLPIGKKAKSQ